MISRTRWTPTFVLSAMVIGTLLLAIPLLAQQQNPASADTSSQGQSKTGEKSGDNKDPAIQEQKSPKNDRLFFALPNYLTGRMPKSSRRSRLGRNSSWWPWERSTPSSTRT